METTEETKEAVSSLTQTLTGSESGTSASESQTTQTQEKPEEKSGEETKEESQFKEYLQKLDDESKEGKSEEKKKEEAETKTESTTETKTETKLDSDDKHLNDLVKQVKRVDGELKYPEGMSDNDKKLVKVEIRRRDTQAEFTKAKQKAASFEKTLDRIRQSISIPLTKEQQEELEKIDVTDREAYFNKRLEFEKANREQMEKDIDIETNETDVLAQRDKFLGEFNAARKAEGKVTIDLNLMNSGEVPPKYWKQIQSGEVNFEQGIKQVGEFLDKGKVTSGKESVPNQPDLTSSPGNPSTKSPSQSTLESLESQYSNLYRGDKN